jgi:hypothetical protein
LPLVLAHTASALALAAAAWPPKHPDNIPPRMFFIKAAE